MIRLAILGTRGIPARYGGFETFAEQLATRLADRGVYVTVFCPAPSPRCDETYRRVTLRFVRFPRLGKYSEMFWDVKCFCAACGQFDVVYMLGLGGAFAAWIPRVFGACVWMNTDGIEWKRKKFTWPQRAYLAVSEALSMLFASRIVADACAVSDYLRRRYPGLKHITTIAYGADLPVREPDVNLLEEWHLVPDGYYIVVNRLEPENHVLEIVQGFEHTKCSLPLVVLGSIDCPNKYVRALLAHSSDRVRFIGTVYDKNRLEALRFYARAYIHGHSVGGTNPSLLEAMACANLVVAHDNPFNREVLGDAGMYFSTCDELANIVDDVEDNRVYAGVLRQKAADIVASRYRWEDIADAYLTLLHEI